uniref:FBA_2 domain-containing protein n=1 Tax=Caenorhabditis tropicalis TaxID=1561998 RepID=A0A1I7UZ79_9PELO
MCLKVDNKLLSVCIGKEMVDQIIVLRRLRMFLRNGEKSERVFIGNRPGMFIQTSKGPEVGVGRDEPNDFKVLVDYISDLFDTVPTVIHTSPGNLWLLTLYRNPLELIYIPAAKQPLTYEETQLALTSRASTVLQIDAEIAPGLLYTGPFGPFNKLKIETFKWVTVENLVSMAETCEEIYAKNVKVTCDRVNIFVKHWMERTMDLFRCLIVHVGFADFREVFMGLQRDDEVMVIQPGTPAVRRNDGRVLAGIVAPGGRLIILVF